MADDDAPEPSGAPSLLDQDDDGQPDDDTTDDDRRRRGLDASAEDPDAGAIPLTEGRGDPDRGAGEGAGGVRRRLALDGRTLAICFLVAAIAALLAGVIASAVIDDGGGGEAGSDEVGEGTLSEAEEMPDVPLERFDGTPLDLSDYRGQALVVNFWGSWCQPCVKEMPDFQRVHESLGDDVAFLGVNVNDDAEDALRMAERTGVTYDLAVDTEGEMIRELGVVIFPTTVLILPDGTVVDTAQGPISAERLCDKINQSLLNGQLEECG